MVLVFVEYFREVSKQHVGVEEYVVEVHRVGSFKPRVISLEDLAYEGFVGAPVLLLYLGVVAIVLWGVEGGLRHGDAVEDIFCGIGLGVELPVLEYVVDKCLRVVGVVYGEVGGVSEACGLNAQYPCKDGVECAHPYVPRCAGLDKLHDALLHLLGGFVSESECHDGEWVDALLYHIGNTVSQGTGLS